MTLSVDLATLSPEDSDRLLGALLARYDRALADEIAAILRGWADQTEAYEQHGTPNPRGSRTPADYRRLADAIDEHAAHIDSER
jgi:hypothetical protein